MGRTLVSAIVTDWPRLSRWPGWATSKLPFMGAAALLFTPIHSSASELLAIIATISFWAAFGYAVNDVADRSDDQRAGKSNRAADVSTFSWGAFLFLTASLSLGLSLLWAPDAAAPALVLVGLMLAAAYSPSVDT